MVTKNLSAQPKGKKAKYEVKADGKTYPTNNPNFEPKKAGETTRIEFNKDNSITYTPKGSMESFNLTKEEYANLRGKPGFETSKTKRIEAINQGAIQEEMQSTLQEQQAEELKALGQEDFTKLGQEQQPQEQPQQTEGVEAEQATQGTQPTFQNRVLNSLLGNQMQLAAQAAGGELATGALPLAGGGAIAGLTKALPKVEFVKSLKSLKDSVSSLKAISIIGGLATTGYGFLTKGKVRDVEGDISDIVSKSNNLARQVSNGADPVVVRDSLQEAEAEVRDKIAELNTAKRLSISDRIIGSDSQEYAEKQLTAIVLRRQAVERFMLSGDLNAFNSVMGVYSE